MPKKITIYLTDESDAVIEERRRSDVSVSKMLAEMIERYTEICRALTPKLEQSDWEVILQALKRLDVENKFAKAIVVDTMERHPGVPGHLMNRLRTCNTAQIFGIIDTCEKYWSARDRGESPTLPGGD